jgi:AcrR family transcriptional regulator
MVSYVDEPHGESVAGEKQRARSAADKAERTAAILNAAAALFDESGFYAINMAQVAKRAGLAKGTLYLYFRTKEELFLALIERDLIPWMARLEEQISPDGSLADLAGFIPASLVSRPRLLRLLGLLHVVLEQNIEEAPLAAFKARLRDGLGVLGAALETAYGLAPGDGARFLLTTYALILGFFNLGYPADTVQRILDRPDMAPLRVDFESGLEDALHRLALSHSPNTETKERD